MISLLVDECYALDYLSILEIKKDRDSSSYNSWEECKSHLYLQIPNLLYKILESEEYKNLYEANLKTFDAVDKARSGEEITAKQVDNCNMLRYNCKVALQSKFFTDSMMREVKIT